MPGYQDFSSCVFGLRVSDARKVDAPSGPLSASIRSVSKMFAAMGAHLKAMQSSEAEASPAVDGLSMLHAVVHQEGSNERFGRRSELAWSERLTEIRLNPNTTVQSVKPVAVASQLSLPAGCQQDLSRRALSRVCQALSCVRGLSFAPPFLPPEPPTPPLKRHLSSTRLPPPRSPPPPPQARSACVISLKIVLLCQRGFLQALAADPRKKGDIRDLRVTGLRMPEAAAALGTEAHPGCGVLQLVLQLLMVGGIVHDYVLVPSVVQDALLPILAKRGVSPDACHICWETTTVRHRGHESACCWVAIRTQSAESAEALKRQLDSCNLAQELQQVLKIEEMLPDAPGRIAFRSDDVEFQAQTSFFEFSVKEIRVVGGRILDIIDPSRASTDPMCSDETFFPPPKAPKLQDQGLDAWNIPRIPNSAAARRRPRPSSAGAPRWLPAVLEEAPEPGALRFASEVSGIPWLGPRTLSSPLYQRLGELLTAMQPLFAQLTPRVHCGSGGNAAFPSAVFWQPLGLQSKVLVKAQVYEVCSGEEILGEIHQEGTPDDRIQMVGLYYPLVDDTVEGGDLEITVVMTGGCGSQVPQSKTIPVTAGTAIVFDNHAAYHRMTALRTGAAACGGRRLVVAFFVLEDSLPPEVPCSDRVCVNYADKALVAQWMPSGTLHPFFVVLGSLIK